MTAMTAIFITHFIMRSIFVSLTHVSGIIYPLRIANIFTLEINSNELKMLWFCQVLGFSLSGPKRPQKGPNIFGALSIGTQG
jgi:hypothetical protein